MERLFLVTRRDLPPGAQASQLVHALRQFVKEHPTVELAWFENSNTIVLLSVEDELELKSLIEDARIKGLAVSSFEEPDLQNALTAIVLEPRAKRLVRDLPLAFT